MDYKNKTKEILLFLDNNPNLNDIFEYFVIKKEILTLPEFFSNKKNIFNKLEQNNFNENEINLILQFINFDKVTIEDRELILFTKEDKLMLLHHFPEIKELYEKQNFGKFNDRKHEEAIFWNNFFNEQQKNNSFISGKGFDNLKVKEKVADFVEEKLKNIEKKIEMDLNYNFEEISNIENEEKFLNVPRIEQTNVLNNINNYSLSILYKNLTEDEKNNSKKLVKKKLEKEKSIEEMEIEENFDNDKGTNIEDNIQNEENLNLIKNQINNFESNRRNLKMKIEDEEDQYKEFYIYKELKEKNENDKEIELEPVSPLKRRNSFSIKNQKEEDLNVDRKFSKYYQNYISGLTKKLDEKINKNSIENFFQKNEENNSMVLASINDQIRRQMNMEELNLADFKNNYVSDYLQKYENFNDNLKILLNIFYQLFPLDKNENGKKILSIAKKLQTVKNQIKEFKNYIKEQINSTSELYNIHIQPLEQLEKLIIFAFEKVKDI